MKNFHVIVAWVAGLCCAVSGWAAPAKNAAEKNAPEKSTPEVARVNDEGVSVALFELALKDQLRAGAQDSAALREGIRRDLVLQTFLAQQAVKSRLEKAAEVQLRMESSRKSVLAAAWQQQYAQLRYLARQFRGHQGGEHPRALVAQVGVIEGLLGLPHRLGDGVVLCDGCASHGRRTHGGTAERGADLVGFVIPEQNAGDQDDVHQPAGEIVELTAEDQHAAGDGTQSRPQGKNARLLMEAGVSRPKTGSAYFFARVPAARAGLRPPWPRPIDLASSERALA